MQFGSPNDPSRLRKAPRTSTQQSIQITSNFRSDVDSTFFNVLDDRFSALATREAFFQFWQCRKTHLKTLTKTPPQKSPRWSQRLKAQAQKTRHEYVRRSGGDSSQELLGKNCVQFRPNPLTRTRSAKTSGLAGYATREQFVLVCLPLRKPPHRASQTLKIQA